MPVCLCPRARMMAGVGDRLGPEIALPKLFAVLVNPRIDAPTPKVFAALGLAPGSEWNLPAPAPFAIGADAPAFLNSLSAGRNDLEAAAISIVPAIGAILDRLARTPKSKLARMSGSGSTCFALFEDRRHAADARRLIAAEQPGWWVKATSLH